MEIRESSSAILIYTVYCDFYTRPILKMYSVLFDILFSYDNGLKIYLFFSLYIITFIMFSLIQL